MKQAYELAEMEILSYCDEDVIRTSITNNGQYGQTTGSETGWEDWGNMSITP